MTTTEKVKALRTADPKMRAIAIAKHLSITRARVGQILAELNLPTRFALERLPCPLCLKKKDSRAPVCRACSKKLHNITVSCQKCDKLFTLQRSVLKARLQQYQFLTCSHSCSLSLRWDIGAVRKQQAEKVALICTGCGKQFKRYQSSQREREGRGCKRAFCDRSCYLKNAAHKH